MLIRSYVFLIGLLLVALQVTAQPILGSDDYLVLPEELSDYQSTSFMRRLYSGGNLEELTYRKGSSAWVVYSDRPDNPGKESPTAAGRPIPGVRALDYMERLQVKEVSGNWLRVFSPVYEHNGVFKKHVDRGWVRAEQLVLSNYALLNDLGAPRKAMALISLSEDLTLEDLPTDMQKKYDMYLDPARRKFNKSSKKFKIRFILKDNGGVKLLSSTDKLQGSGTQVSGVVDGWMSNAQITEWNHRVCLEPSSFSRSVEAYSGREIPVYPTQRDLNKHHNLGLLNTKGSILNNILRNKRPNPYMMRMPILTNFSEDQYGTKEVATVGRIDVAETGAKEANAEFQEELNELLKRQQSVNILFVVDGTKSMSPYYKAVASSIEEVIRNKELTGTQSTLRFGLAVYRDYADGEEAVEVESLTGNHQRIIDKLLRTECKSKDKDTPEAQYHGIIEGVKKAGFIKGQSNVVVLIGDAGNHSPDPKGITLKDVSNELSKYEVNLIAFQVIYGGDNSFIDFNFDAQTLLRSIGESMDVLKSVQSKLLLHPTIPNTYTLKYESSQGEDLTDLYLFGRYSYADANKQMSTQILETNITNGLSRYLASLDQKISDIRGIVEDGGAESEGGMQGSEYDEAILDYLCKKMTAEGGSYEDCRERLRKMGEFSFKGFTSMKFYGQSTEAYQAVVYLSEDELDKIIRVLNSVKGDLNNYEKRRALYNALLEQAKNILGDDSPDNIEDKSLNDIWEIILGIPFDANQSYGSLSTLKLRDFTSSNSSSFDRFMRDFESSLSRFEKSRFRDMRFELAGQKFYWIPLNKFPGNGR